MNLIFTGLPFATLAAIFAVLAAVFFVFYLLKTKTETVEVPHLLLWEKVLREERASSWWERWKRWFSLLLILIIAASIILAVGDPRSASEMERGSSTVIIIDQSGSMRALDGGENQTRFERAVTEARKVVSELQPQDEVSLITVDAASTIRVAFTSEHDKVNDVLSELTPTDLSGDIASALDVGAKLLEGRESGTLFVLTDSVPVDLPPAQGSTRIVPVSIGSDADNIAVTGFRLRRYPLAPTEFETMVRVTNASDDSQAVSIEILADGETVEFFREEVPAQETAVFIYPDLPDAGQRWVVQASAVDENFIDVQPLDNIGYASLTDRSILRVLLVSNGNLYLEAPLLLNEAVNAERMTWAEFEVASDDALSAYDTFMFDGAPGNFAATTPGDKLYFPGLSEEADTNYLNEPIIDRIDETHRIMRAISSMRDVNIARAVRLEADDNDEVVARAISGAPMILTRRTNDGNEVHFAFDPAESDLPLRIAFPLLLANITDWFRIAGTGGETSYAVGETIRVHVPEDHDEYTLGSEPPEGIDALGPLFAEQSYPSFAIRSVQGAVDLTPNLAGFYTLTSESHQQLLAVTSSDPREAFLAVTSPAGAPTDTVAVEGTNRREDPLDLKLWTQLLLVAIGLLTLEWFTWTRRLTV